MFGRQEARRYRGRTMQEAVGRVRAALGDNAILLSSKKRPKYWLFGPVQVEVLASAGTPAPVAKGRPQAAAAPPMDAGMPQAQATAEPAIQQALTELLVAAGVAAGIAGQISRRALAGERRMLEARQLVASIGAAIAAFTGHGAAPVEVIPGTRRVICFVGPPGSGKTTALTKLACQLALGHNCAVELINTDNVRPGAGDQLARFAAILGLEYKSTHTPGELRHRINGSQSDIVLVDTAGCSWRDPSDLAAIAGVLEGAGASEVHLVIPATYEPSQAGHLVSALRHLGLDRLLLTRLDEIDSYGPAINLICQARLPLSYLSAGAFVPGQLDIPVFGEIAEDLVNGRPPVGGRIPGEEGVFRARA